MHAETKYIPHIIHTNLKKEMKIVDLGRQRGKSGWKLNGPEGTQSGAEHSASLRVSVSSQGLSWISHDA